MSSNVIRFLFLSVILLFISHRLHFAQTSVLTNNTENLIRYQDEISIPFLRSHLQFIASDEMKGRDTGSRELEEVSRYLADQYEAMGLAPAVGDTSFLQPYRLNADITDSLSFLVKHNATGDVLIHSTAGPDKHSDFVKIFGGSKPTDGKIVFAGFGVDDTLRGVNHLGEMELRDRWVMVYEEIPAVIEGDTLIDPEIDARQRFQDIVLQRKAKGLIVINGDSSAFRKQQKQQNVSLGKPVNMRLAYRGSQPQPDWVYLTVHPAAAEKILGLKSGESLEEEKRYLIENIDSFKPRLLPLTFHYDVYSRHTTLTVHNVAAVVEGSDPIKKNEYVILSAHHDHVGVGVPDSTGDVIYNGADDDGSGTVALLNIAKALETAVNDGYRPRRSIMFLHVSGEEKGLLGSRYYSDHPEVPIQNTIANINIDMIGRIDHKHAEMRMENYAYIIGGDIISSGLDSLIRRANEESGQIIFSNRYNTLHDPNQFYRRSDHWNFGRLGVPFAFFFTGVHEDYHRPSDEIEKIRFEKMARIIKTIYASVVLLSETEKRPEVDNQSFINITRTLSR